MDYAWSDILLETEDPASKEALSSTQRDAAICMCCLKDQAFASSRESQWEGLMIKLHPDH